MNPRRPAGAIPSAVIAYCEAMEVPDFNAAIVARNREHRVGRVRGSRTRAVLIVAPVVVVLLALFNMPAVVAGIERALQAFSVAAGRSTPMTIRVVDLDRARADAPFTVLVPPPIAAAPIVTVEEIYGAASRSDASVIFEVHGTLPGHEVMIVESKAAMHSPTLLSVRGPADAGSLPPLRSNDRRASSGRRSPAVQLHGTIDGRAFTPTTWVAHGTRIVIMSPPGFLSDAQIRAIQRAMSR